MKKTLNWIWQKAINFFKWIWRECRNWQTLLLLAIVCAVVGSPVWVCGLLWLLFHWEWAFVVSAALLAFWWLPGMPYFAVCVSITLVTKRFYGKRKAQKRIKKTGSLDGVSSLHNACTCDTEDGREDRNEEKQGSVDDEATD